MPRQSSVIVEPALAQMMAKMDVPQSAFRVWNALILFMKGRNQVDARLFDLAKESQLSTSAVQRSVLILEQQGLIIKVSGKNQNSEWIINPELLWNTKHDQRRAAISQYKKLKDNQLPYRETIWYDDPFFEDE